MVPKITKIGKKDEKSLGLLIEKYFIATKNNTQAS